MLHRNGDCPKETIKFCPYLCRLQTTKRKCVERELPTSKIDETLAQLSSASIFSKLYANSGFWQI